MGYMVEKIKQIDSHTVRLWGQINIDGVTFKVKWK